jgi:hypothetical protein
VARLTPATAATSFIVGLRGNVSRRLLIEGSHSSAQLR